MEIYPKATALVALATVLALPTAFAAEKIQITESTSVQLPKPNEVLENSRKMRNFDGPSGRSTYEGSLIPSGPMMLPSNPQADKKFKDMIDKKKNWIFVNPYEAQYDTKTQEFLKGEKGTALYNHPLMQEENKGVVQRFIEEKSQNRDFEGERTENSDRSERDRDREAEPGDLRINGGRDLGSVDQGPEGTVNRGLILGSPLEQKSLLSQDRNRFQERLEKSPLSDSLFGSTSRQSERSVFSKEERAARDAELNKIYQPRIPGMESSLTSRGANLDPLNSFDANRQEATPFSGRRTDQLFNTGRADEGGLGGTRNSPIFAGPSFGSTPGAGLDPRSAERSSFDFSSKAPQASAFAPSVTPSPNRTSDLLNKPAPFVLPLPQRKF